MGKNIFAPIFLISEVWWLLKDEILWLCIKKIFKINWATFQYIMLSILKIIAIKDKKKIWQKWS